MAASGEMGGGRGALWKRELFPTKQSKQYTYKHQIDKSIGIGIYLLKDYFIEVKQTKSVNNNFDYKGKVT